MTGTPQPVIGPTAPTPVPRRAVRLVLRLATAEDGPTIGNMLRLSGWEIEGLDWSDPSPNWLVADIDGLIAGCVCVFPGRPIGWVEFLCVEPELRQRTRAKVAKALLEQAMRTIKAGRGQVSAGGVPDRLPDYQRVLERRGCQVAASRANVYARRL